MAAAHEIRPGVLVMCLGNTPNLEHRKFAGTVHTVKDSAVMARGEGTCTVWTLEPPTMIHGDFELVWSHDYLKVLRNPGEDERDESTAYLPPVPMKVAA